MEVCSFMLYPNKPTNLHHTGRCGPQSGLQKKKATPEGNTKAGFGRFFDTLTEKQKEVCVGLPYLILSLILSQEKIAELVCHDLILSITLTLFMSVQEMPTQQRIEEKLEARQVACIISFNVPYELL